MRCSLKIYWRNTLSPRPLSSLTKFKVKAIAALTILSSRLEKESAWWRASPIPTTRAHTTHHTPTAALTLQRKCLCQFPSWKNTMFTFSLYFYVYRTERFRLHVSRGNSCRDCQQRGGCCYKAKCFCTCFTLSFISCYAMWDEKITLAWIVTKNNVNL